MPRTFLAAAWLAAACTRPETHVRTDAAHTAAPSSAPVRWADGVSPYPRAHLLCDEHVALRPTLPADRGKPPRVVTWQSYGTEDAPERVVAYYATDAATAPLANGDETRIDLDFTLQVSVFKLPTTQVFPRCAGATPAVTDRTLLVVRRSAVR